LSLLHLKKYKLNICFRDGHTMTVETNTDIKKAPIYRLNGAEFITTEEMTAINISLIEKLEIETRY